MIWVYGKMRRESPWEKNCFRLFLQKVFVLRQHVIKKEEDVAVRFSTTRKMTGSVTIVFVIIPKIQRTRYELPRATQDEENGGGTDEHDDRVMSIQGYISQETVYRGLTTEDKTWKFVNNLKITLHFWKRQRRKTTSLHVTLRSLRDNKYI